MRRFLLYIMVLSLAFCCVGCQMGWEKQEVKKTKKDFYSIGILQFAQTEEQDACRHGFIEGLKEGGFAEGLNITLDYQNAKKSMDNADLMVQSMIRSDADLFFAITMPMAQIAYKHASSLDLPVVYGYVPNPVIAELAAKDGSSVGNMTGVASSVMVEEELQLVRELLPQAKTIGIIYSDCECYSLPEVKRFKNLALKYGFRIEDASFKTVEDVIPTLNNLLPKVDCLVCLPDNTVNTALEDVLLEAEKQNKLVFGSEAEQVQRGCIAAEAVDYFALGKDAGHMAGTVISKKKRADDIDFANSKKSILYINEKELKKNNLILSQDMHKRAVFN